ncbi:MAG TPA: phenylacetate--CoA ligase family protein [Gammaproteobacteria bacterium]|jgi:phenylacetate-CoA ligase
MTNPAIPGAEFLPLDEIRLLQRERWARQREYLQARSAFYGNNFAPLPRSLDEFVDFPLTDKQMLRDDQARHPPFGSYLASDADRISRVHRTSGTTGVAMNLALSRADAEMTASVAGRAQSAAGLGPGYRVVHCLNYCLWMGGYSDHAGLEATGATVVPYGVGGSEGLIRVIQELGIDAISCTPSYPGLLEQVIADKFPGLEPRDLGLRLGLFGGEPGLDEAAFRERLESTWGFEARNANFGVSDVLCNFAAQTEQCSDLHLVGCDVLYPELIEPQSGDLLPWREGERGELVLTHLAKECQPLLRFRSGDIVDLTATDIAACGRSAPRFRVVGRSDDMVVVRGLNLFPAMIGGVLHRFAELSGGWQVRLDAPPPYDFLPLQAELAYPVGEGEALARRVEAAIKAELGASARVVLLDPGSLPRTEGKTRYVFRTCQ